MSSILNFFRRHRMELIAILVIVAVGLAVYYNSLTGKFINDDYPQLVANPNFAPGRSFLEFFAPQNIVNIHKPVLFAVFGILRSIFGLNPIPFHIFQVLLHTTNAILVFFLFFQFRRYFLSLGLATLFLVHPMNSEAVAFISATQEPLFLFFGLVALLLVKTSLRRVLKISLITFLLLLSIMSKETGVLFGPILIVWAVIWDRSNWRLYLIPAVAATVFFGITRFILPTDTQALAWTSSQMSSLPLGERLLSAPAIILFYFKTFFLPKDLIFLQDWVVRTPDFGNFYFPLFVVLAGLTGLVVITIYIYRRHHPVFAEFIFFTVCLLFGLGFHLQLYPLDLTVSDRWMYLPMIGLLGMIGVVLTVVTPGWITKKKRFVIILFFVVLGALSWRTTARNSDFANNESIYGHDVKLNTDGYLMQNGWANTLIEQKHYDQAIYYLTRSIKLMSGVANKNAWITLGAITEAEGNHTEAADYFAQYTNLVPEDPRGYENTLLALIRAGEYQDALPIAKYAASKFPDQTHFKVLLASDQYLMGDRSGALQTIQSADQNDPIVKSLVEVISKNEALTAPDNLQ